MNTSGLPFTECTGIALNIFFITPYFLISDDLKYAFILDETLGSDYCPIGIEINLSNILEEKSLRIDM